MGVTPEMNADKRDVLARNLVRAPLDGELEVAVPHLSPAVR